MSRSDPFEDFRRARIKEARPRDRAPERREFGAQISGIIDRVTGAGPPPDAEAEKRTMTVVAPSAREVEQIVARLLAEIVQSPNPGKREQLSAFLASFVEVARRLLSEEGRITFSRDEEYETDFGELFAFMRNPDVRALRRERGLP